VSRDETVSVGPVTVPCHHCGKPCQAPDGSPSWDWWRIGGRNVAVHKGGCPPIDPIEPHFVGLPWTAS
jgi:hypothetical protein